MKIYDYNKGEEKVLLLIHPLLSSPKDMKLYVTDHLGKGYRFLLPALSGHEEGGKTVYGSAKQEADRIYSYLKEENIEKVEMAFGASLGCLVLYRLLEHKDIYFKNIFLEGSSFYESAPVIKAVMVKTLLKTRQQVRQKPKFVSEKISSIYGKEAGGKMMEGLATMDETSLRNIAEDFTHVDLPTLSEEEQKRTTFAFGQRDMNLKKARKVIAGKYPGARLRIWRNCDHCEKMISQPEVYAAMLKDYLR